LFSRVGWDDDSAGDAVIPSSIQIETARCRLRKVAREDIPFVFSATRYPGFCDGMRWSPPSTEAELVEPLEKHAAAWDAGEEYTFTIVTRDGARPVGRISIRCVEADCWNIGFWTHPLHQRRGYMTEAAAAVLEFGFRELSAGKIEAASATWNAASRSVLQKIGMSFARHVPQGFQKDGRWIAEDVFAITRTEWSSRPRLS